MKSQRFSVSIAFAFSLFLVFVFILSWLMRTSTCALAQTETAAPAPTPNAAFNGKIVVVNFVQGSNLINAALEQVQVHKLCDRYFLVGKGVDVEGQNNLVKGHMTWIPVNSVTAWSEMDSVEELLRAAGKASQKGLPATPLATTP